MERRGKDDGLTNENRLACAARENFDGGANAFDYGRTDENHFEGLIAE